MIGTYINLSLPSASDTMSDVVSKTATCLGQLRDSIADKATQAGINVNGALALGGNQLTGVGGVTLADGNNPTAAGSVYFHNGEFFLVDSTSTIQLTSNGQVDVASVGGIGGDYGGSNPALVSYNTANSVYRFYVNPTGPVWADTSGRGMILNGAAGSIRQLCSAGFAGAHDITWPTALPSRQAAMTLDDTGQLATKPGSLYVGTQAFTSGAGTFTYTPSSGVTRIEIEAVGGGGGGGGVSANAILGGGGGGSGGYAVWVVGDGTNLITGSANNVVVGAFGTRGDTTGGSGGAGGDTSVTVNGVTYIAHGGAGGTGCSTATAYAPGGAMGTSTSTNRIKVAGESGDDGVGVFNSSHLFAVGGRGGSTPMGGGGASQFVYGSTTPYSRQGADGTLGGCGGGGGGACICTGHAASAQLGGAGLAGGVLIREYV